MPGSISARRTGDITIDVVNAVLGLCLALSPWVLGFVAQSAAAWNAWTAGAVIALIAGGALISFAPWEEWANLILGIWVVVAPWVLGFTSVAYATYAHVSVGIAVALLAAVELLLVRKRPIPT